MRGFFDGIGGNDFNIQLIANWVGNKAGIICALPGALTKGTWNRFQAPVFAWLPDRQARRKINLVLY